MFPCSGIVAACCSGVQARGWFPTAHLVPGSCRLGRAGLTCQFSAHASAGLLSIWEVLSSQVGKGVVRRGGKDVALVAYGTMVNSALAAAELLAQSGVAATVADMRRAPTLLFPWTTPHLPKPNTTCPWRSHHHLVDHTATGMSQACSPGGKGQVIQG